RELAGPELEADSLRQPVGAERQEDGEGPVDPDLGLVADADLDEGAIGGSGKEDGGYEREHGDAGRRSERNIAGTVEEIVLRVIAGDAPLDRWPCEEKPEDRQREERPAPKRVGHERVAADRDVEGRH